MAQYAGNLTVATERLKELERLLASIKATEYVSRNRESLDLQSKLVITNELKDLRVVVYIDERRRSICGYGELCFPVGADTKTKHDELFSNSLVFSSELDFFKAAEDLVERFRTETHPRTLQSCRIGIPRVASLISIPERQISPSTTHQIFDPYLVVNPQVLDIVTTKCEFDREKLDSYLFEQQDPNSRALDTSRQVHVQYQIQALRACAIMADLYDGMPGASISTSVLNQSLYLAKWIPQTQGLEAVSLSPSTTLSLREAFSCIVMFESGTCNLDPSSLGEVFAMSSGNSLYIAEPLLCDPYEQPLPGKVRRVVGNIGRPGITFLISPPELKTKHESQILRIGWPLITINLTVLLRITLHKRQFT